MLHPKNSGVAGSGISGASSIEKMEWGFRPFYIRMPKPGKYCPYSGLSRNSLSKLIKGPDPKVKSRLIKDPDKSRGVRLIHFDLLMAFIENCEE